MSDIYVIRRRKKSGKGWEYLGSVGNSFGPLPAAHRFQGRPIRRWSEQVCRMVPTVRWAVRVTDNHGGSRELPALTPQMAVETRDLWLDRGRVRANIIKRTTWRPEVVQ